MENFYTLLSNTGINAIIAARASNSEVKLTKIAVGDGDIIPSQDMTALKSEKHRFNINSIIQDIDNPNYLIVEGVIPSNVGGFYVSEVAIYTDQNTLFAIGSLPKTYKPLLEEGSAKDLTIKIFLEVTNADSVTLKVDDSVVLATRKFVLSELKKYALINGDETKRFKVADAVELNEAITKKQFDDNAVKLSGNQTIAGTKTFSSSPIVPTPNANTHAVNKDYVDTKPSGFKNLIINPNKTINQRGTTGTALNTYYQDRWAGNGSGGLYQKIENVNIQISGTYTISWTGTAKCTISDSTNNTTYTVISSNLDSGAKITLTANRYVKIEFSSTDFTNVQLEFGSAATSFEQRPFSLEISLCQRYYEKSYSLNTPPATVTFLDAIVGDASQVSDINCEFKIEKRVKPTITFYSALTGTAGVICYKNTMSTTPQGDTSVLGSWVGTKRLAVESSPGDTYLPIIHFTADAEL
ncbi:phage tail protein [Arcobacter cryaerophilus gv. pseudocryaerophilus]|uniref:Phage tail protein n=3 Tax=Arcobacteraceae TaxID=2808963 RepID=A0AA96DTU8_9BACT|nr:phage tail protein [Arcobacter sp. AZ-2023]WNL36457.1 phage tail protein [Arcobacter sp. AZ-2023]WPD12173.1 phage tail protein [Arcobacter sp. DSM 115960]